MSIDKATIYRIKDGAREFRDFLRLDGMKTITLPANLGVEGPVSAVAGVKVHPGRERTHENIPWLVFINDGLPEEEAFAFRSRNSFPAGVVALKFGDGEAAKFFVLTFGLGGDTLVDNEHVVRDFGLRVAMNICDPDRLKRIQTSIHEAVSTQAERQISIGSSFSVFNIDDEKEFLRTVAGYAPPQYDFLQSFVGRDSITIKASKDNAIDWANLVARVSLLGAAHDNEDFKTRFPGYAKFHFENDPAIITALDDELFDKIKAGQTEAIHLAPPEVLDYGSVEFSYGHNDDRFDDLALRDLIASRRAFGERSTIDSIKQIKVVVWSLETGNRLRDWTGYKCLVAELERGNDVFILSNAQWKRVARELKSEVTEYLAQVTQNADGFLLDGVNIWDAATKRNREEMFNAAVAQNSADVVLFDKAKIEIAGQRFYETCDVFHKQRKFIQVKRFSSGSASVSHLFVQGKFYAEAFLSDDECRKGMRKHVDDNVVAPHKDEFLRLIPLSRLEVRSNDYTVVFCILSTEPMDLDDLPFMARYELMHTHRHLVNVLGMGCEIAFKSVQTGPP